MKARRRGLTLIELMVTTVLAGLIMSSLMHVVTMTGRMQHTMAQTAARDLAWQKRLTQQLSRDLTHTHTATWADGMLLLEGWNGWDRRTGEAIHEPSRIVYRLVTIGPEQMALVREQRDLLDLGQQRPKSTLIAVNVESMAIEARNTSRDVIHSDEFSSGPQASEPTSLSETRRAYEDSRDPSDGKWDLIITFDVDKPVVVPIPTLALQPERRLP